jgi:hypothetical protein
MRSDRSTLHPAGFEPPSPFLLQLFALFINFSPTRRVRGARMSCAAPEASSRGQVGTKHVFGGTSYGDDPTSLRDSAIALAEAGEVRAAIPLFQAVVALDPSQPLGHSDEGVSWMRLKEYDQARLAPTPLSHPCPCHRRPPWLRAVLGRLQARARARPGARPVAAEPERPHRLPLSHLRRPAHHARQPVA